ncbi:extracellular solute-binding protein [Paenibacillus hemerocallicola]|uniref:Extracellular solute-binding protein n=1 Tax=Paenibacillus hemerocallicola TaxID=1172614 RepID=A0A5C4SXD1_9BACL|nr:extracellular solute-binding protein [Paenibacillus hemerocallicola]TNJ60657.1 extracellular solute-binding protein [Paenibacillus hemerocallicola]
MSKQRTFALALSLLVLGITGCSSGGGASSGETGKPAPVKEPDPVTLKLFTHQPMTAADFQLLIADPVKKKYPYITVELLPYKSTDLENSVAAKEQIDLITIWNGNINPNRELGIFGDITPLAKTENFDLGRFDQDALKTLRTLSDKGELYGLPYNMQFNALYYNKDIFDKFGVPYPQDGMTWDETLQLAKRLTRTEGGTAYSGLGMDAWSRLTYPLSIIPVDAKTNLSAVNSELYRKAFTLGKQIYSIPGNTPNFTTNDFIKDKKQAMIASVNLLDLLTKSDLNWDIAQFPSYKENPNVYGMYDLHVIAISSTSKYKEAAMKTLEVLFSDENQKISTRNTGRVSLLTNPDIRKEFGADNPALKDKKLNSIFKSKPAYAPPFSKFQSKGSEIVLKHYKEFLADQKDLNTMLRDAEEEINQYIKTQ